VRQSGKMIGKLHRDQRSGVRDQKRKDLRRRWRGCLGGGGLDKKRLGAVGSISSVPRFRGGQLVPDTFQFDEAQPQSWNSANSGPPAQSVAVVDSEDLHSG
jgi:hypothetical protein